MHRPNAKGSLLLVATAALYTSLLAPLSAALPEDALLIPGSVPLDTDGNLVHAHGGGLLQDDNGTFYWFGESEKVFSLGVDFLSAGVNLYTSQDLATWRFAGLIFNSSAQITGMPYEGPYRVERPKILYNRLHARYVLLFHVDNINFTAAAVGVASAPSIYGPYTFVRAFKPDGLPSYDLGVLQEEDGSAFLIRSVDNSLLGISQLSEDYANTTGIVSVLTRGEGPALFKPAPGSYYLLASHLTYWAPNQAQLFHAAAPSLRAASWRPLEAPVYGAGANITYDSQPSFVFPLQLSDGTLLHVYMGDRWNFAGPGSVANASYVWLPLLPRSNGLGYELRWAAQWRPSDYRADAQLPVSLNSNSSLTQGLSAVEAAWLQEQLLAKHEVLTASD